LIVQEHRAFPNMFKNDFGHNHIGGVIPEVEDNLS
jgi:hypothetical protein